MASNFIQANFSWCKSLGLMKSFITPDQGADLIVKRLQSNNADPQFIEEVKKALQKKMKLVVPLYYYDCDVNYVYQGKTYNKHVKDLGYYGVHKDIEVLSYVGDGDYKTIGSIDELKNAGYDAWHDRSVFSRDSMKQALVKKIDEVLPRGYASFESQNWSVSCFFVPCIAVWVKFGGKDYNLSCNLHNQKTHLDNFPRWQGPIKRAKLASKLSKVIIIASFVMGAVPAIIAFAAQKWICLLYTAAALITAFILFKKEDGRNYKLEKHFAKNPMPNVATGMIPSFVCAGIALVCLIAGVITYLQ